jgi:hypothetical protein
VTRAQIAAVCLLLFGCDGVGRALVANGGGEGGDDLTCQPVECTEVLLPEVRAVPPSFTDPQLADCKPADPQLCDPASEPSPDLGRDEPTPCRRTISLDDDFDQAALRNLHCGRLKLARAQAGEGVVHLANVRWTRVALEIETSDPLRLELSAAQLTQVSLHLRGPVELRMVEGAKAERVGVTSDDRDTIFELDGSSADTLRTGDEEGEYAGRLSLVRSSVTSAHLRAREMHFETASLTEATLEARTLYWFDVTARRVELAADEAAISASRLSQFDVTRCGQLSRYRVVAEKFRIPSCGGDRTRLFESLFSRGSLDGVLAGDSSEFNQVVFGFHEPTVLQLWDGSLGNTNFCGGTERVVVAGRVSSICAICREVDGGNVSIDACAHKNAKLTFLKSCTQLDELASCNPTPERMRPPLN